MKMADLFINKTRADPIIKGGIQAYAQDKHIKEAVALRQIVVAGLKATGFWPESMLRTASGAEHTMLIDAPVKYTTDDAKGD
jgi:hypothetical protein